MVENMMARDAEKALAFIGKRPPKWKDQCEPPWAFTRDECYLPLPQPPTHAYVRS